MEKSMRRLKIPHTDSIEELAKFWDTHDLVDFEDELEEVREPIFEYREDEPVMIHLPVKEVEALKRLAKARRTGPATLIREWVLEKLRQS